MTSAEEKAAEPSQNRRDRILVEWLCLGLLMAACFAVYANGYAHAFNLDSGHGLLDNPSVRSLANIPRYFEDPFTLTVYRANVDYRPVLQTTFAVNYAISGYAMWSWHLFQVLLHCVVTIALYVFSRQIVGLLSPQTTVGTRRAIGLAVALLHAVHPVNAGVVMYLWARSTLLVAALVLPSFAVFIRARQRGRIPILSFLLFGLALLTKLETIGVLGVYVLLEVLVRRARRSDREGGSSLIRDVLRACWGRSGAILAPFVLIAGGYFALYNRLMPDFAEDARQLSGTGHLGYLTTQLTAWWHYVYNWLAPLELVADDLAYPEYSPLNPIVLLALGGWLVVAVILRAAYTKSPQLLLVALAGLAVIAPTSSVMPLAEMVNEHRPYLPIALLSVVVLAPAGVWLSQRVRQLSGRAALMLSLAAVLAALSSLTWQRNQVFENNEGYWADILDKAPSSRAHLNYGLAQMREGRYELAIEHYEASLALAPYWDITHIDIGIAHNELGNLATAEWHFDQAVEHAIYTSMGLEYRGRFYLEHGRYREAAADFTQALELTMKPFEVHQGLATAYAGLAHAERAFEHTARCFEIDPAYTEQVFVEIVTPFWDGPIQHFAGVAFFERVNTELLPNRDWVAESLSMLGELARDRAPDALGQLRVQADALLAAGQYQEASDAFYEVLRFQPHDFAVLQGLATAFAGQGDDEAAFYYTLQCVAVDQAAGLAAVVAISTPFFGDPDLHDAGLRYFVHLEQQLPEAAWIRENQARLLERMGRLDEAAARRAVPADTSR